MSSDNQKAQPCNAAALREALLVVKRLFDGMIMFQPDIRKAHKAVDAALAASPRNCDVFRDAKSAQQAWLDDDANWDDFGRCNLDLHEWLYASAKAKTKGKDNGNK